MSQRGNNTNYFTLFFNKDEVHVCNNVCDNYIVKLSQPTTHVILHEIDNRKSKQHTSHIVNNKTATDTNM